MSSSMAPTADRMNRVGNSKTVVCIAFVIPILVCKIVHCSTVEFDCIFICVSSFSSCTQEPWLNCGDVDDSYMDEWI